MDVQFRLFGAWHLGILAAVVAASWVLTRLSRVHARAVRLGLAAVLAVNEVIWYTFRIRTEGFHPPEGLPLQLSDLLVWLTVIALVTRNQTVFELGFFAGIAGAGMALVTPDLWAPFCSYPSIYFFVAHGLIVSSLAMLAWSGQMRPQRGCVWRAMGALNAYAAAIFVFNLVFQTNYMYLRQKPEGASLLDYMGPWPWYIAAGEFVALALFWLMWLPFRRAGEGVGIGEQKRGV
jgi:hypothetical integral membrane protein (TIGR02206 family)